MRRSFTAICIFIILLTTVSSLAQEMPSSSDGATMAAPLTGDLSSKLQSVLERWHDAGLFDGAVLVAKGDSVWQSATGMAVREFKIPNTPETRYPIASLTKQFTAVLTMMRVQNGEIALDDKIGQHLPWLRKEIAERISIRDLLSHTSGIPGIPLSLYANDVSDSVNARWVIETYCKGALQFEPATNFAYTNTDYHMLGALLEELSGKSFEQVVTEDIFQPLGMVNSGIARRHEIIPMLARDYAPADSVWQHGPTYRWHNWQAAGGLYSTLGDLHRWNRALMQHKLLNEETLELMLTPRADVGSTGNYVALGSWVYPRRLPGSELQPTIVERRGAIGGYTILNAIVKEKNWSVIILSNHYNEQMHQLPWGHSMPVDLLMVMYGLEPQGLAPQSTN